MKILIVLDSLASGAQNKKLLAEGFIKKGLGLMFFVIIQVKIFPNQIS